ncbi:MFS general substrate transporter [Gloeopeniophorella convolvens]|nr:MFS general substrate transporter [Gloeopeniophorella convolvens]
MEKDTAPTALRLTAVPHKRASGAHPKHSDSEKGSPVSPSDENAAVLRAVNQPTEDNYPNGGFEAWSVVIGGICINFSTLGYINTWGAFQEYYENVVLKGHTPSEIAWIGSTQYALVFLPALLVRRLFDLGHFHGPLFAATVVLILCTFLTAKCTKYWQFLLCQGFGIGLASSVIACFGTSTVAHWFKRRRKPALSVFAFGSPLGGAVFPILFRNLHIAVGFKWAMRTIAFIHILTLGVANLTLKRRLPPKLVPGGLLNLKQFKDPAYTVYCLSGFTTFLGLYTMLTFINASAQSQGASGALTFYYVSIANAGSAAGHLAIGLIANRFGPLTVIIPATFLAGILTYVWPFVRGEAALVTVSLLYGMFSGAYAGFMLAPMMALGETSDVGRRTGMYLTALAPGELVGPPISGAINRATEGFEAVGIYAGSAVMIAVVLLTLSRYYVLGGWRGKA